MATIQSEAVPAMAHASEEEEEDYMKMTIPEPSQSKEKETYTQRRRRKEREAESKRPKSKEETARLAAAAREAALAQPLHASEPSSKGLKMMRAMGFQTGGVLGKQQEGSDARAEPLTVQIKEDRSGIGLESEKKRKIREEFEEEIKRQKVDEGDFRERVRAEREIRRTEGQFLAAQKVAERLAAETEPNRDTSIRDNEKDGLDQPKVERDDEGVKSTKPGARFSSTPLKQINVLWRGLVRHREEKERERRMRYDLHQSLSRRPTYEDPDEDEDDKLALAKPDKQGILEEELEEEDPELEEFSSLEPAERLKRLLDHLRQRYRYCFWCKYQYPDETMDGCPGVTEEDHD